MAALGHMQIPFKLVRFRLGLSFISFVCLSCLFAWVFSLFLFRFFRILWLFYFYQKQRVKIGLLKGCVTKHLDLPCL